MSGAYISDVQWCPHDDHLFLTAGSDLQLYRVKQLTSEDDTQPPCLKLNKTTGAQLIATNSDRKSISCTAWCNGLNSHNCHLLAVGQTDGYVTVTSFNKDGDIYNIHGKEYVSKHIRRVNSLAWSSLEKHLLAVGLDKTGRDNSLLVFDVTKQTYGYDSHRGASTSNMMRLMMETGSGDTVNCVDFSRTCPRTVIGGFNSKQIKLFDMRDSKTPSKVTNKAAEGLCCNPLIDHRLASYYENQVCIWDLRMFGRPVLTFSEPKSFIKLAWSPTRQDCLASLCFDSRVIKLHELQNLGQSGSRNEQEMMISSRFITTEKTSLPLSSFSWHPTEENRMLITASCPGELMDVMLHERITLNWCVRGDIVWTQGKRNLIHLDPTQESYSAIGDISSLIIDRAEKKYGLYSNDLSRNGEVTNNPSLQNAWTWLEQARAFSQSGKYKVPGGELYKYQGVMSILNISHHKSEVYNKHWIGRDDTKLGYVRAYRSEARNLALQLCSWGCDDNASLNQLCDQLEASGEVTRAVALCVFNLRLTQAITILNRAADTHNNSNYNTLAMALSGFTDQKKGLWRDTCTKLQDKFSDSYLRAAFSFLLSSDGDNFDSVLTEIGVNIQDQVGFGCLYLSDLKLHEYLENFQTNLMKNGCLDALLLTGLTDEGLELLQRYIDLTGDVQTPALLCIHGLQLTQVKDERVNIWVESYRNLLDNLRLWNERAKLDSFLYKNVKGKDKPQQQVYIACNFCSKSISAYIQAPGRATNPFARFGSSASNESKMSACPHCKKPLPRCSICLQNMGTPSERHVTNIRQYSLAVSHEAKGGSRHSAQSKTLSAFATWFTWCQTCRHGGHAHHVMDWFKEHLECPVTSCTCKCMSIDPLGKVLSAAVSKTTISSSPLVAK